MATQQQWESIPDVEEQTQLDEPIKVKWQSHDRARVRRGLHAALEDGWMERAIARPVMSRQKTQIVIRTEEELAALRAELKSAAVKWKVRKRIEDEIETQLNGSDDAEDDAEDEPDAYQRRKEETDLDALMDEIVIPHARKKVQEVWPGGTVDVDEIDWFWNHHLRSCAGRAYWWGAEPSKRYDVTEPAIGLSPKYYYTHGLDELLKTARHELIHIWQFRHENGKTRGGHGPDFKQWLDEDDMDCDRYCKHW